MFESSVKNVKPNCGNQLSLKQAGQCNCNKNIMPSEYLKDYSLKSNYDKINLFAFFLILHRLRKLAMNTMCCF